VLLALSSGQKAGILVVAAIFIVFALSASFLLPRRNPDFPTGRGLPLFVVASIALFVAMMAAMAVFAREDEEEAAGREPVATETQPSGTEPAPTETGDAAAPQGNAEAGADVFQSAGCGGCHTLEAAGAGGTIGPSLDESQPAHDLVVDRVTNGMGAMPAFGDQLSEEQIQDVAAFVVESTR
jgi:mono/diheme cytochrome c family protein